MGWVSREADRAGGTARGNRSPIRENDSVIYAGTVDRGGAASVVVIPSAARDLESSARETGFCLNGSPLVFFRRRIGLIGPSPRIKHQAVVRGLSSIRPSQPQKIGESYARV